MTNFERITKTPETLGAFLSALPCIEGPWNEEFQQRFCAACIEPECESCPHEDCRNAPAWWLTLGAGRVEEQGTVVIDLELAETERELAPEKRAEMERLRPMFRYFISDTEEKTESEISSMDIPELEKATLKFLAANNPEKRVIEIGIPGGGTIQLHGAADTNFFISLIQDQSRTAFHNKP